MKKAIFVYLFAIFLILCCATTIGINAVLLSTYSSKLSEINTSFDEYLIGQLKYFGIAESPLVVAKLKQINAEYGLVINGKIKSINNAYSSVLIELITSCCSCFFGIMILAFIPFINEYNKIFICSVSSCLLLLPSFLMISGNTLCFMEWDLFLTFDTLGKVFTKWNVVMIIINCFATIVLVFNVVKMLRYKVNNSNVPINNADIHV